MNPHVAFAFMITQTVPAYLSAPLGLMSEKEKQLPLLLLTFFCQLSVCLLVHPTPIKPTFSLKLQLVASSQLCE